MSMGFNEKDTYPNREYNWTGIVDPEWGTICPNFSIGNTLTSGKLKYFSALKGKTLRITIEVLD